MRVKFVHVYVIRQLLRLPRSCMRVAKGTQLQSQAPRAQRSLCLAHFASSSSRGRAATTSLNAPAVNKPSSSACPAAAVGYGSGSE